MTHPMTCACGRRFKRPGNLFRHESVCPKGPTSAERRAHDHDKAKLVREWEEWHRLHGSGSFEGWLRWLLGWYDDARRRSGRPEITSYERIIVREMAAERGRAGAFDRIRDEAEQRAQDKAEEKATLR